MGYEYSCKHSLEAHTWPTVCVLQKCVCALPACNHIQQTIKEMPRNLWDPDQIQGSTLQVHAVHKFLTTFYTQYMLASRQSLTGPSSRLRCAHIPWHTLHACVWLAACAPLIMLSCCLEPCICCVLTLKYVKNVHTLLSTLTKLHTMLATMCSSGHMQALNPCDGVLVLVAVRLHERAGILFMLFSHHVLPVSTVIQMLERVYMLGKSCINFDWHYTIIPQPSICMWLHMVNVCATLIPMPWHYFHAVWCMILCCIYQPWCSVCVCVHVTVGE